MKETLWKNFLFFYEYPKTCVEIFRTKISGKIVNEILIESNKIFENFKKLTRVNTCVF